MIAVRDDLYVGDIGTVIRLRLLDDDEVVDVSSATVKKIKFKKPDGTVVTKDAVFTGNGSDGQIQYVTEDPSILDLAGRWKIQGYVEMPSGKWHSSKVEALVRDVLS